MEQKCKRNGQPAGRVGDVERTDGGDTHGSETRREQTSKLGAKIGRTWTNIGSTGDGRGTNVVRTWDEHGTDT